MKTDYDTGVSAILDLIQRAFEESYERAYIKITYSWLDLATPPHSDQDALAALRQASPSPLSRTSLFSFPKIDPSE